MTVLPSHPSYLLFAVVPTKIAFQGSRNKPYPEFVFQPIPDSTINQFRRSVDHTFGIKTHKQSIAAVLGGGAKVKIEVGFQPKDDSLKTSLIIVR